VSPTGYKPQAYYLPVEVHERLKAAWWALHDKNVDPAVAETLAEYVANLLGDEATRLEQTYNGGNRFPPAPRRARGTRVEARQRQSEYMTQVWSDRAGKDE
jgi:hypothetical protein